MAREFVCLTIGDEQMDEAMESENSCRAILNNLEPSPDHFFWFEYNFLFILAANGRANKEALGDHSPRGYEQRSRFYSISDEGRLLYAKRVAEYIIFLAENTGVVELSKCKEVRQELGQIECLKTFLSSIAG